MPRTRQQRRSSNLTLLRGTTTGSSLLQLLTGNSDPNAPVATLQHSIDLASIGYLAGAGAGLIIFNHVLNSQTRKK